MRSGFVILILNEEWRLKETMPGALSQGPGAGKAPPETLAELTPSAFSFCGFGRGAKRWGEGRGGVTV